MKNCVPPPLLNMLPFLLTNELLIIYGRTAFVKQYKNCKSFNIYSKGILNRKKGDDYVDSLGKDLLNDSRDVGEKGKS